MIIIEGEYTEWLAWMYIIELNEHCNDTKAVLLI